APDAARSVAQSSNLRGERNMTVTKTQTEMIAKARSTFLGIEDHGIFTGWVDLDLGGGGRQAAGALCLDYSPPPERNRVESSPGGVHRWVCGVLRAFGVSQWEMIPGRTVYAVREAGKVIGFRPLPTEPGAEFMFEEVFPDAD